MKKNYKKIIHEFLKKNAGKRFVLKDLAKKTKMSYPTLLKYVPWLVADKDLKPKVFLEDHGSIKFVWVEVGK